MTRPPGPERDYVNAWLVLILTGMLLAVFVFAAWAAIDTAAYVILLALAAMYWVGYRDYPARMREAWSWVRWHRAQRRLRDPGFHGGSTNSP